MNITVNLNGAERRLAIHPGELLIEVLRREGLHSVKRGCQDGNCGTCVVQVDGAAQNACLVLAAQVDGRRVETCEGIGDLESPHPIQRAFAKAAAVQCGFCTPGLVMSTKALLEAVPNPSDADVRERLDGNICRCTGYVKIFDAVRDAAAVLREAP